MEVERRTGMTNLLGLVEKFVEVQTEHNRDTSRVLTELQVSVSRIDTSLEKLTGIEKTLEDHADDAQDLKDRVVAIETRCLHSNAKLDSTNAKLDSTNSKVEEISKKPGQLALSSWIFIAGIVVSGVLGGFIASLFK